MAGSKYERGTAVHSMWLLEKTKMANHLSIGYQDGWWCVHVRTDDGPAGCPDGCSTGCVLEFATLADARQWLDGYMAGRRVQADKLTHFNKETTK